MFISYITGKTIPADRGEMRLDVDGEKIRPDKEGEGTRSIDAKESADAEGSADAKWSANAER